MRFTLLHPEHPLLSDFKLAPRYSHGQRNPRDGLQFCVSAIYNLLQKDVYERRLGPGIAHQATFLFENNV